MFRAKLPAELALRYEQESQKLPTLWRNAAFGHQRHRESAACQKQALFPPLSLVSLSITSVTNFKVKSLLKQSEPQLQGAQKVDCPPLQRDREFERVKVRARAKTQIG